MPPWHVLSRYALRCEQQEISDEPAMKNARNTWHSSVPKPTGEQIAQLRLEAGMTQAQLADLAQVSSWRKVSAWESGEHLPQAHTWELLLLRLGKHPTKVLMDREAIST